MTAELIYYSKGTVTETGKYPWHKPERDNWYAWSANRPEGTTLGRAKRTAHAAAIGRAILADLRTSSDTPVTAVHVYAYDTDQDTTPAVTADGQELVNIENEAALAVVTDPRPVGDKIEALERDLEAARMAQRVYDAARARVMLGVREVYVASDELEPGEPSHRSANALAAMTKGLISRPTILKILSVHEEEADL